MSLYNMLHGVNPLSPLLLKVLEIDQEGSRYESGRFRDIHLNEDATRILLFTRNGGGNREQYQEVIDVLAEHPNYIEDYDDDFDCTYAYIVFSVPEEHREYLSQFATGKSPLSVGERFQETMKEMEGMTKEQIENDPRFSSTVKMLKEILENEN